MSTLERHTAVAGAPLQRPPLFNEGDRWPTIAGKTILYVVLSPMIAIYVVVDASPEALRASWAFLQHMSGQLLSMLARGICIVAELTAKLTDVAWRQLICPTANGIRCVVCATALGLHDFLLMPACKALCITAHGIREYILSPTWHGLCLLANFSTRTTIATVDGAWRLVCVTARAVHDWVIIPAWQAACSLGNGMTAVVFMPAWNAIRSTTAGIHTYILIPAWNGACATLDAASTVVASFTHGTWWVVRFTALGLRDMVLHPLWKGVCFASELSVSAITALAEFTFNVVSLTAGGVIDHVLIPSVKLCVKLCVTLYESATTASSFLAYRVVLPLWAAHVSAFRWLKLVSWRYAIGPLWQGASFITRGIGWAMISAAGHVWRYALVPLGRGALNLAKGLYLCILLPSASAVYKALDLTAQGAAWVVTTASLGVKTIFTTMGNLAWHIHAIAIKPVLATLHRCTDSFLDGIRAVANVVRQGTSAAVATIRFYAYQIHKAAKATATHVTVGARSLRKVVRNAFGIYRRQGNKGTGTRTRASETDHWGGSARATI